MPTRVVKEGSFYRHYKGAAYQVIKIAYNTEGKVLATADDIDNDVKLVVYKPVKQDPLLGDDVWWVRPYALFVENVTIQGKEQPRFVELQDEK
jgi:hypothetical protein